MPGRATRREFVAAGAGVALASAVGPEIAAAARAARDRDLLRAVLRIERLALWCYERVLSTGSLEPEGARVVSRLLGHEREHIAALERELAARGGAPHISWSLSSARHALERHHVGASPTRLGTQRESVRLLIDVESVVEGAWFSALGRLSDPRLAGLGASIMACEAQHWTLLSGLSHPGELDKTVPYPFVRGSSGY